MFSLIQNHNPSSQYVPYLPNQVQPSTLPSNNDNYKFTTLYILTHPILSTKSIKTKAISNIKYSYIQGKNEKNLTYKQILYNGLTMGKKLCLKR